MNRRRRRLLWTIRWHFDEFKRLLCCGFFKKRNTEIPMNHLISSPNNEDDDGDDDEEKEERKDRLGSTPFLSNFPKLLQSPSASLTTCIQCGRVFPDFFHGIRVIYRQGPWDWTCGPCASSNLSNPTTPLTVVPPRKST